ncbi:MAG TPA: formate dehydrogenase accessory sulfurtransferase FdhD [Candidatus Nanopelagicales bacterium]|nr:formate dehydrogenase accessory sulfurtransferase FdhD [Candidatus Nanopelagicales bacterium]
MAPPLPLPPDDRTSTVRDILVVRAGTAERAGSTERRPDRLAGEEPMAIRVAGPGQVPVDVAVTMRTPGCDAELAVGFLVSEGLLAPADLVGLTVEAGDPADVATPENELVVRIGRAFAAAAVPDRAFVVSASCGICGKASLDDVAVRCAPLPPGPRVDAALIAALPDHLRTGQAVFAQTGGLHAAGLFDAAGALLAVREDVGRHNALDKLIGAAALAGDLPLHGRLLAVSGRVSFEIVQKAAVAGIPIVAAVSAPTDLAVEAAERLGMTLIGFVRGGGFNVYCGEERIAIE